MAKQIPIPTDRALEQEPKMGENIIPKKQGQPLEYGSRYRNRHKLPEGFIVEIGEI
jgi:hypothetical protein